MKTLPRPERWLKPDTSLAIVNIVFLLIFFFLATGQLLNAPSQGVALASTTDLPLDRLPSPILVTDRDGGLTLDGVPVPEGGLAAAINALPPPVVLHLLIEGTAPAADLLALLARSELQGLELRLVTLNRPTP